MPPFASTVSGLVRRGSTLTVELGGVGAPPPARAREILRLALQMKVPFSRQRATSSSALQMVDGRQ